MSDLLNQYRNAIVKASEAMLRSDPTLNGTLEIERSANLAVSYAPFEHIEENARLVLVGITPGMLQASNALIALRKALLAGDDDVTALAKAKIYASFSGAMRSNLVALLDSLGLHRWLEVNSTSELWNQSRHLVHFTSALRNPVFVSGKNYSGAPSILRTPLLKSYVELWLVEEARLLGEAVWVPLGPAAAEGLSLLVVHGILDGSRVLRGLPHPSGANAERIAYFLRRKTREQLSTKTNPDSIEPARDELERLVAALA